METQAVELQDLLVSKLKLRLSEVTYSPVLTYFKKLQEVITEEQREKGFRTRMPFLFGANRSIPPEEYTAMVIQVSQNTLAQLSCLGLAYHGYEWDEKLLCPGTAPVFLKLPVKLTGIIGFKPQIEFYLVSWVDVTQHWHVVITSDLQAALGASFSISRQAQRDAPGIPSNSMPWGSTPVTLETVMRELSDKILDFPVKSVVLIERSDLLKIQETLILHEDVNFLMGEGVYAGKIKGVEIILIPWSEAKLSENIFTALQDKIAEAGDKFPNAKYLMLASSDLLLRKRGGAA